MLKAKTSSTIHRETQPGKVASGSAAAGRQRGFTLMELLVVLAILGLLMSLVGPRVLNQLGGAKSKTAGIQVRDLEQSLEMYKLDVGRFPSNEEGLSALVTKPGSATGWNGPYLDAQNGVPTDPWGEPFIYEVVSPAQVVVRSLGRDKQEGGEGQDADIVRTVQ